MIRKTNAEWRFPAHLRTNTDKQTFKHNLECVIHQARDVEHQLASYEQGENMIQKRPGTHYVILDWKWLNTNINMLGVKNKIECQVWRFSAIFIPCYDIMEPMRCLTRPQQQVWHVRVSFAFSCLVRQCLHAWSWKSVSVPSFSIKSGHYSGDKRPQAMIGQGSTRSRTCRSVKTAWRSIKTWSQHVCVL